jgi:hypothetical protein
MQAPEHIDQFLRAAIAQKRTIRFSYNDKERISEPHDYGVQKGRALLLTYQIGGQSSSGTLPDWRWIDVSKISDLEILDATFDGNRPAPSGKHHKWDQLFIRVGDETQP